MRLFVDSADMHQAAYWIDSGVIDGITTNPSLVRAAGYSDYHKAVRQIAERFPETEISIQLTSSDPDAMLAEGRALTGEIPGAVIKVPVVTAFGEPRFGAIRAMSAAGLSVNATACLTVGQAVLASKAGARYASLLWGRIADEGGDPGKVVSALRRILDRSDAATEVLVASLRGAADVTLALLAGADVVTVSPAVLGRWADHHYARATVAQFDSDLRSTGA
jgi:transaldolase